MTQEINDANLLFDTMIEELNLKSDAALANLLESLPPTISNMRAGRVKVGPTIILAAIEHGHFSLPRVRRLLAGIKD